MKQSVSSGRFAQWRSHTWWRLHLNLLEMAMRIDICNSGFMERRSRSVDNEDCVRMGVGDAQGSSSSRSVDDEDIFLH